VVGCCCSRLGSEKSLLRKGDAVPFYPATASEFSRGYGSSPVEYLLSCNVVRFQFVCFLSSIQMNLGHQFMYVA